LAGTFAAGRATEYPLDDRSLAPQHSIERRMDVAELDLAHHAARDFRLVRAYCHGEALAVQPPNTFGGTGDQDKVVLMLVARFSTTTPSRSRRTSFTIDGRSWSASIHGG